MVATMVHAYRASDKSQICSFLGHQVGSHRGYDGSHRGHDGAAVFIHFLLSFWLIFDLVFFFDVASILQAFAL
jgi:hypothetical protein